MGAAQAAEDFLPSEDIEHDPDSGRPAFLRAVRARWDALSIRWWEAAGYGSLLIVGLAMRLWDLGSRPLHHDESLHALYSWNLFTGVGYQHNPMMHGPFQFEANAILFLIFGDSDFSARLLYAVAGTLLIAMPLLLRSRLGRLGALCVSLLLAASPSILYFSRFARNDILMAVWTFGLVICMWRYFDEGRNRYLYIAAALMALAFASKESTYLVIGMLGLWSLLMAARPSLSAAFDQVEVEGLSPPAAFGRLIRSVRAQYAGWDGDFAKLSRPAIFFVFLISVTLPLWAAFAAIFQHTPLFSWTGLELAAPEGSPRIGDPVGGANVIAFALIGGLFALSVYIGHRWNWSLWWRCALVFYAIWTLLYTTFMTNPYGGLKSGIWQSLGYWIVQQGEARGGQPWYYYFAISSVYEFLPLFVGVIAVVWYIVRRDMFGIFLAYWALMTFLLYTIASEKMPWLLVGIALPFIVLAGRFLSEVIRRFDWRAVSRGGGWLIIPGVPVFAALLWNLALYPASEPTLVSVGMQLGMGAMILAIGALAVYWARCFGWAIFLRATLLLTVGMMLALTVRAGAVASYQNSAIPVEMLVYTQTSPDLTRLMSTLDETGEDTLIAIDSHNGFTWPWVWYFRGEQRAQFPTYNKDSFDNTPAAPIVVVHSRSRESADSKLMAEYGRGELVRHRWWFPEETYRGLTLGKIAGSLFDRSAWRGVMDYWLNREGVRHMIGSENSYVYFRKDIPSDYEGREEPGVP